MLLGSRKNLFSFWALASIYSGSNRRRSLYTTLMWLHIPRPGAPQSSDAHSISTAASAKVRAYLREFALEPSRPMVGVLSCRGLLGDILHAKCGYLGPLSSLNVQGIQASLLTWGTALKRAPALKRPFSELTPMLLWKLGLDCL